MIFEADVYLWLLRMDLYFIMLSELNAHLLCSARQIIMYPARPILIILHEMKACASLIEPLLSCLPF